MGEEVRHKELGKPLQIVREHIWFENAHDLTAVIGTFGSTARYDDEPWDEHHEGHAAVQSFYASLFSAIPDMQIEVTKEHVSNAAVIVECVIHGTHLGSWRGLPPTGRRIRLPLCGVYTFAEDGRISGEKIYYDRATLLRQIGVFREPVNLASRLLLLLNHPVSITSAWFSRSRKSTSASEAK